MKLNTHNCVKGSFRNLGGYRVKRESSNIGGNLFIDLGGGNVKGEISSGMEDDMEREGADDL